MLIQKNESKTENEEKAVLEANSKKILKKAIEIGTVILITMRIHYLTIQIVKCAPLLNIVMIAVTDMVLLK